MAMIVKEDFHGWANTYRVSNGIIEVRVVTDVGPRIIDVRVSGGENLLYVRAGEVGGQREDAWVFRGGWRLWVAPERTETTYAPDNSPCETAIVNGSTLQVTAPPQPAAGIQKLVSITLDPETPRVRVESRIRNVSDRPLTYAAWSLPALRPGGRAFVPLDVGPLTAFDSLHQLILWSYTKMSDPRYRWGDRIIEIDHARVPPPQAGQTGRRDDESKIGVDSTQGWAAYALDRTLFLKRFPHDPEGCYPDRGATVEVYSSAEFLELEHLGPLTTIAPAGEIDFPEDWWVLDGVTIEGTGDAAVADLHRLIENRTGSATL